MKETARSPTVEAELSIEERRHKRHMEDIKEIVQLPAGRRLIWELLGYCRIMHSSMSSDTHVTAYNEGRRGVGLHVLGELMEANPDAYCKMQKEHRQEAEEEAAIMTDAKKEEAESNEWV